MGSISPKQRELKYIWRGILEDIERDKILD